MRKIYLILFLIFSFLANAQEEKIITLTTIGSGPTKDVARQIALKNAIEQAFGAFISTKTELLNDKLISDEMTSVSSGNIKSYEVLSEEQLPNSHWGSTIKAKVSLSKLTSFVESKGVQVDFKGNLFAINIKQQQLNEEGEVKVITEMVGLLHESMQISFDYQIKSSVPKSLDAENKNWEIPLEVIAIANKNMDLCAEYFLKNLQSVSLSNAEVESYKSLNKKVYSIVINYKGESKKYFFRKLYSMFALQSFAENWEFYTRTFIVQSAIDESIGKGVGKVMKFIESDFSIHLESPMYVKFPSANVEVAKFNWNDKKTLAQIEKMNGYTIKPSGVISQFQHGGYVVHGPLDVTYSIGIIVYNDEGVISGIAPESPAYRAGMGDKSIQGSKITSVNGKTFTGLLDIHNALRNGDTISLEIIYSREPVTYKIKPVLIPPQNGLVAALFDIGQIFWDDAIRKCDELFLNGYNDWRLPTKDELQDINTILIQKGLGYFKKRESYWTASEVNKDSAWYFWIPDGYPTYGTGDDKHGQQYYVRPVRSFGNKGTW